jgi:hypothetical protein
MNPSPKISHTILDFGKEIISELLMDHLISDLEAALLIIVTVWNSLTLDEGNGNQDNENALLKTIEPAPKQIQLKIRQLISRKKTFFSGDSRLVGNHWIRENNGELLFGCEVRAVIDNLPVDNQIQ